MRVSVAMATYNGEAYVSSQLKSILEQTVPLYEIVICDDHSNDGTVEILRDFQRLYPDMITLVCNEKNLGYKKNFEKAVSLCTGDIIALSDQDDIWDPDKISIMIECMDSFDLLYSDARLIDKDGKLLHESFTVYSGKNTAKQNFLDLCISNTVTGCTVIFRSSLLKKALPFPDEIPHDHWLALIAKDGNGLGYLDKSLVSYRQHGSNTIGAKPVHSGEKKSHRTKEQIFYDRLQKYETLERIASDRFTDRNKKVISQIKSYYESFFTRRFRPSSFIFFVTHIRALGHRKSMFSLLAALKRSLFGRKLRHE